MQSDQLILSPADSEAVRQLAQRTGKSEDELLHDAITNLVSYVPTASRLVALRQARGMWEHRADLPDFTQVRAEGWQSTATSATSSHE